MALSVLIADDHELFRSGLKQLLVDELGAQIVREAETFDQAVEILTNEGAGDLILTCTGELSRNRKVGLMLVRQHELPDILHKLGHVAEGVHTVREVHHLARLAALQAVAKGG